MKFVVDHFSSLYVGLWLLSFLALASQWRRFFFDYAQGTARALWILWPLALGYLLVDFYTLPAAALNLFCAHYFFIRQRWSSLLRGMGAPGAMLFWLSLALFMLEVFPAPVALRALQIDFALIFLSSGMSKLVGGYFHGEGMEYGLANPMWSRWPSFFAGLSPDHLLFRALNQTAWSFQILAGLCLLVPGLAPWGASLLIVTFFVLAVFLRLGFLCESVILAALLVLGDTAPMPPALIVYCFLRTMGLLGQWINFYFRRPLPGIWQSTLDGFANLTGLSLWRVFTVDSINFVVRVIDHEEDARFRQVAENITLATLFSTLKYQPALFEEKLKRYARTFTAEGGALVFRYFAIEKGSTGFRYIPTVEYEVDLVTDKVSERRLEAGRDPRTISARSAVHACLTPGSYLPVGAA